MEVNIDPRIKPLYANLLRLGIGKYLISKNFDHLCIENNIDQLWNQSENYVRRRSDVAILIPGYAGYAEEALGLFLEELIEKDEFLEILSKILADFAEWSTESKDFSKIRNSLLVLGYNEDDLDQIFSKIEEQIIGPISEEVPNFERTTEVDENLCFVLMPFDEKFTPIYENIIKTVVESAGLECKRADEIFGIKPIIEDIWEYIQKARILIADLTRRNPNVFYELGIAHAINKDVILITQDLKDLPFDLKHYRCIVYEDSVAGGNKLNEGLKNTLKEVLGEE